MTGDNEERQLKQKLLMLDVSLRRKQEFWETPRNLAILVGITAAIAAAIGFWLGREATPPPAPHVSPISNGNFGMTGDAIVEATQTASLVVITVMLIYVVVRLDRTLTSAAEKIQGALSDVMKQQSQLLLNVRRIWERIDLIESRENKGAQQNDRAVGRAWQHIEKVETRLEALEKGEPRPERTRPTDPPLGSPKLEGDDDHPPVDH